MALIVRKKYTLCSSSLSVAMDGSTTSISFNTALKEGGGSGTNIPTLGVNDYLVLAVDNELMYLTAYTSGATSGTVIRAREGTIAASHSISAKVKNVSTKLDYAEIRDNLWTPNPTTTFLAGTDEFDDNSIHSDWVRVDKVGNSANLTWTERDGVMSLLHQGSDLTGEFHGLMRPLGGLSAPLTIETCQRSAGPYTTSYLMNGLGFSNGITHGSGSLITQHSFGHAGNASGLRITSYNVTSWNSVAVITDLGDTQSPGGRYYLRLQWVSANTWSSWWSGDGVSWIPVMVNAAMTMTPTYMGMVHSHYGGDLKTVSTYEYFRVF